MFDVIIERLHQDFQFNKSSDFIQVELVGVYSVKLVRAQMEGNTQAAESLDRMIRCHMKDLKTTKVAREIEKNFFLEAGKRSGRVSEASDEHGHVGLIEFVSGDGQYQPGKVVFGSIQVKSVQGKKDECGHDADALVAIDKGMVFYQVEQVGCGHLVDVRVQELPTIGSRRHAEGGLEQLDIPDAGSAPVSCHLILVDLQHLGQAEEDRIHRLLRQLLQSLGVPGIGLVKGGLEGRAPVRIFYWGKYKHLPVGGNVKLCVYVSAEQLQDRFFDHQRQAVAVFGQGFDHGMNLPCSLIHCFHKDTTSRLPGQGPLQIMARGRRTKSVFRRGRSFIKKGARRRPFSFCDGPYRS